MSPSCLRLLRPGIPEAGADLREVGEVPSMLPSCAAGDCVSCRRLIYYPQSDWDTEQFAIYLTPVASQHSRVGWLRQVSFNVRVHGHDSPSQSIWASEFSKPAGTFPLLHQLTSLSLESILAKLSASDCILLVRLPRTNAELR